MINSIKQTIFSGFIFFMLVVSSQIVMAQSQGSITTVNKVATYSAQQHVTIEKIEPIKATDPIVNTNNRIVDNLTETPKGISFKATESMRRKHTDFLKKHSGIPTYILKCSRRIVIC